MNSRVQPRIWWVCLFLFAAIIWSKHIDRPVDLPSWHEFDYSAIARNFVQEGDNVLYPRIDWRKDSPGYTEMEFPLHPWLMAEVYRVAGVHEIAGRLISYLATLLSLAVFCRLALYLLPEGAAWAATLFFTVSRETTYVASAIQPEALMLLFYLLAAYCFLVWYDKGSRWHYFAAVAAYAGAMLIKSPAAHLGFLFFFFALKKDGLRAVVRPALWVFALAALIPVVLWYSHAYSLWTTYHNSMGVSNEDHWIGLDMLRRPNAFVGLIGIELLFVFGIGGGVVALLGVRKHWQTPAVQFALLWAAAIAIYYLVIIRTAGAYWAWYYHIVAVPPAALLFGSGIDWLKKSGYQVRALIWGGLAAAVPLVAALHIANHYAWTKFQSVTQELFGAQLSWTALLALSLACLALTALIPRLFGTEPAENAAAAVSLPISLGMGAAIFTYFVICGQLTLSMWTQFRTRTPDFDCSPCFADKIAPQALIVASGGRCVDPTGHRTAGDAPQMFFWLDRKGFSICEELQSVTELEALQRRGAAYFVADKAVVAKQPNFETALRQRFPLLGHCSKAWLFQLNAR